MMIIIIILPCWPLFNHSLVIIRGCEETAEQISLFHLAANARSVAKCGRKT